MQESFSFRYSPALVGVVLLCSLFLVAEGGPNTPPFTDDTSAFATCPAAAVALELPQDPATAASRRSRGSAAGNGALNPGVVDADVTLEQPSPMAALAGPNDRKGGRRLLGSNQPCSITINNLCKSGPIYLVFAYQYANKQIQTRGWYKVGRKGRFTFTGVNPLFIRISRPKDKSKWVLAIKPRVKQPAYAFCVSQKPFTIQENPGTGKWTGARRSDIYRLSGKKFVYEGTDCSDVPGGFWTGGFFQPTNCNMAYDLRGC